MICLRCDSEHFTTEDRVIVQLFKGVEYKITTPASVCDHCGWVTVSVEQADELVQRTRMNINKHL